MSRYNQQTTKGRNQVNNLIFRSKGGQIKMTNKQGKQTSCVTHNEPG